MGREHQRPTTRCSPRCGGRSGREGGVDGAIASSHTGSVDSVTEQIPPGLDPTPKVSSRAGVALSPPGSWRGVSRQLIAPGVNFSVPELWRPCVPYE